MRLIKLKYHYYFEQYGEKSRWEITFKDPDNIDLNEAHVTLNKKLGSKFVPAYYGIEWIHGETAYDEAEMDECSGFLPYYKYDGIELTETESFEVHDRTLKEFLKLVENGGVEKRKYAVWEELLWHEEELNENDEGFDFDIKVFSSWKLKDKYNNFYFVHVVIKGIYCRFFQNDSLSAVNFFNGVPMQRKNRLGYSFKDLMIREEKHNREFIKKTLEYYVGLN